jgi:peptidoglycan/LPS O-acetylase OafA/YrhL
MTPKYRPDIDGLRAIAVLAVLFYHTGSDFVNGGYVGVDIFFVISGYLITTIIVREIANGEFSIIRFYERRFRRILPALFVVVVAALVAGSLLLSPEHLYSLGKSAVATAVFSSNILFYLEAGYFDAAAELKPLLHTWSLAVEEQYYIFFPLLLVFIAKIDHKHYLRSLLTLALISLVACVFITPKNPSYAFYLIPTRAWELFIGSILALHVLPGPTDRRLREVLSVIGIALIIYSIFEFDRATLFPYYTALLPTLGTALIIYSGTGGTSTTNSLLSLRPVVFIGLISYSLYLWHWPVLVYAKIYLIKQPTLLEQLAILSAILLLSVLSWHFVETPFRKKSVLATRRPLFTASVLASMVMVCLGSMLVINDGWIRNVDNKLALVSVDNAKKWKHWSSCADGSRADSKKTLCTIGTPGARESFLLWGDSHAIAVASGIDLSAHNHGVSGLVAMRKSCPPLLGIERPNRTSCEAFNRKVIDTLGKL